MLEKCATTGSLVLSIIYDRQSAVVFITAHMMSGNRYDLCLCVSPGVIYYTLVATGGLTCIVSIYTGVYFASKNVMLHNNVCSFIFTLQQAMNCLSVK